MINIAPITPAHYGRILALNTQFVHWLSPLDWDGLIALLGHAAYARQIDDGSAFLLGYDGSSDYRHKNVDWLSARFDSYAYIDRIVVAPDCAGKGYARALYDDFAQWARVQGLSHLAAEVNTKPDNPGSHAAHLRLGFTAIGDAAYGDAAVRYYAKAL